MNDQELFDLCREVRTKTGWMPKGRFFWGESPTAMAGKHSLLENTPLYTSDYLLEKLPRYIRGYYPFSLKQIDGHDEGNWCALYSDDTHDGVLIDVSQFADTPLKALLKLCLALHEAGELK